MWITDAPFKLDNRWVFEGTTPPQPTSRDHVFHSAGEDFVGTMDLARNALGIALYCHAKRDPENISDDREPFWEYRAIAAHWLNIASDRVRDYLIMARFGVHAKQYNKQKPANIHAAFAHPFQNAAPDEGPRVVEVTNALAPLAVELGELRDIRNGIVHEVASRVGANAMSLFMDQSERANRPAAERQVFTPSVAAETDQNPMQTIVESFELEICEALSELKKWYLLLVRSGSLTFEFEYWKRLHQQQQERR
jgi:hypothetical protein